jgi:hypothetical protein
MRELTYRNRRAVRIENASVRVTMTVEGANIAEITCKHTGINPLWTPPWPSLEPTAANHSQLADYGANQESRVLASIMGHSLCLDTYGAPSPEETAAGMPIHGEALALAYEIHGDDLTMNATADLPLARLRFERSVRLAGDSKVAVLQFREAVENLTAFDRPIAWTQHVTLGPPFIDCGKTQFRIGARRSKVIDADFGGANMSGAEFEWPFCPAKDGSTIDLRVFPNHCPSGGFTTHLVNRDLEHGYFVAWSPSSGIAFGYAWKRNDFPWLCRWEENHLRSDPPWNGRTLACGMEFGVSPFVESRREMVTRGSLFGVPTYLWLPAKSRVEVRYCAFIGSAELAPESVVWDERGFVRYEFAAI